MLTSVLRCCSFSLPLKLYYYSLLTNKQGGFTPVYAASQIGQTDIVDLLIKAGANHLASTAVSNNYYILRVRVQLTDRVNGEGLGFPRLRR